MKIGVLSGKGGTGKTLISVNLASVIENSVYLDCDVEEPNGELFFKPEISETRDVNVDIPEFNNDKCIGCHECVDFCNFNALAFIFEKPVLFKEICHSCGGCSLVCQHDAVKEVKKIVGTVEIGKSLNNVVATGKMKIGEASGVPIVKELLKETLKYGSSEVIIDCPPGSGCLVHESIQSVDYCVLVAEPTLFGTHNLEMVYELAKIFRKPIGVVLNKCLEEYNPSEEFCRKNNIKIIGRVPFDHDLGSMNSKGIIATRNSEKYKEVFEKIYNNIRNEVL